MHVTCPNCESESLLPVAEMLARLRNIGMLRRDADPEKEYILELFLTSAGRLPCHECAHVGLVAREADDADEDWRDVRQCESCRKPIPSERLEVFPDAVLCVECQSSEESGRVATEREFCPKCGASMEIRQTRAAGITRYALTCPDCRYQKSA